MARAGVALDRDAGGWVMRLSDGGGGSGGAQAMLPLRLKPPIDEQRVTPRELADMPGVTPEADCPGVDAEGRLVPWFGSSSCVAPASASGAAGDDHAATVTAAVPAAELQDASGATPAAAAAVQAAAAAAAGASANGKPPSLGAVAQAAKAAALGLPPRKRLRRAGEKGSPASSSDPAPSPRGQHLGAGGGAPRDGSTAAVPLLGSPSPPPGDQPEPSGGSGGAFDRDRSGTAEEEGEESEGMQQRGKFDTQCALCDNGGTLLACDGPCMRSFHADLEDGDGSGCNLLLLPLDLARHLADSNETFLCPNCLAGEHQCYVCKQQGKADEDVFKCINASCGRYYHAECVGEEKGQPFVCPLHTCATCGAYAEGGPGKDGELVPCRRCPIAYHRRCLPADLPRCRDPRKPLLPRVWLADYDEEQECWLDGVEQSLCYCRRHRIDPRTQQAEFEVGPVGRLYEPGLQQQYTLMNKRLLSKFRMHYAREYRHLESSRRLLAEIAAKKLQKVNEIKAQAAKRAAAGAAVPVQQKRRRTEAGSAAGTKAAALAAASTSEEDEPLDQKQQRLRKAARSGKLQATAAAAAGKSAPAARTAPSAAPAVQAPRQQPKAQAAATAAAEDEQRGPTVSPESTASPAGTEDAAEAGALIEAGEEVLQQLLPASPAGTEDAAETGGLMEAGEEVLQRLLPAGARPGTLALPPAHTARAHAATEEVASPRKSERRQLQDALDRLLPLPSAKERRQRVQRLLQEAEDDPRLTKDALWHATRRPEPYRHAMKKTIDEGKLANFENAVRHVLTGRVPAHQLLDRAAVQSIVAHYDDLFMVLAPYLHGQRYSSYGRHFTSQALLHRVADRLALFLRSGDQVVDFSCGENHFVPYLKQRCLSMGMAISGRAYDIILAKDSTDFVLKSWFDTKLGEEGLAPRERLCICLNPPFGKNNSLADKFVRHAAMQFQPRLIALIVPPRTIIPPGYEVVLENNKMCGGEEFYVPGSTHRSWNKEWPVLRILMRHECNPARAHEGEPTEFEELLSCTAAVHAQHASQQYQHYAAAAAGYPPQYPMTAAAAAQAPFGAVAQPPWGYTGSFGWPG